MRSDSRRALVVEDSSLQTKVDRMLFQKHQWLITTASNGREALDLLAQDANYNIIILDINMPRMDGLTFLSTMREAGYGEIPVLVASTEGTDEDIRRALKAGARAYMKKPWQPDQLWTLIEKVAL